MGCVVRSQLHCQSSGQKYVDDVFAFERPGIGTGCLYMGLEALGFFLLLILAEVGHDCIDVGNLLSVPVLLVRSIASLWTRLVHIYIVTELWEVVTKQLMRFMSLV